jgi:hypothetical protein
MRLELALALGWTLEAVDELADEELATLLDVLEDRRRHG